MSQKFTKHWYKNGPVAFLLLPLSWLYCQVARFRRSRLEKNRLPVFANRHIPLIVIGNISVGGTGKTPMVIWMAQTLRAHGYKPGIVSRGYGGKDIDTPREVTARSDTVSVGDEAVVMARGAHCPVWVCAKRRDAIQALVNRHPDTDVLISDDGLQHYAMPRDIEIVMIDGQRRFGNGLCLPAGPLRESVSRLNEVDFRVVKGQLKEEGEYSMEIGGDVLVNIKSPGQQLLLSDLKGKTVHAVAGLGNPEPFFNKLEQTGLVIKRHSYSDHHRYRLDDVDFGDDTPVLMTEKDAVKCGVFADKRHWYLPVKARPESAFPTALLGRLKEIQRG